MAGRYASALFDLALEQSAVDQVAADLDILRGLLDETPDLVRLVRSPVFDTDDQSRAAALVHRTIHLTGVVGKDS